MNETKKKQAYLSIVYGVVIFLIGMIELFLTDGLFATLIGFVLCGLGGYGIGLGSDRLSNIRRISERNYITGGKP